MSEIAAKAGASIGSLYQFFPSKQAIVQALRERYRDDFTERWLPIERDFAHLGPEDFASRLMDVVIVFIDTHPAFAALLDAPRSTRIPGSMTARVAGFLMLKKPRMPAKSAAQIAAVTLHILKAFNHAWVEAAAPARAALKREFRTALGCYLSTRLRQEYREGSFVKKDEVLFEIDARPGITQQIFTAGRLRANLRLSEAEEQQYLLTYRQTILQALQQVSDALTAFQKYREYREHEQALAAQDAARLSQLRYRGGAASYLEVLTNETNYYTAEVGLARAQLSERLSLIQVYQALGGGWQD